MLFAAQLVLLLVIGPYADYGSWRPYILICECRSRSFQPIVTNLTLSLVFESITYIVCFALAAIQDYSQWRAVNALWFSSLLLGIFSAISSLLGMEWHSITKWSPRPNNPGFVKNSLKCNNSLLIAFFNSPEGAYTSKRHFNTSTEN